MANESLNEQSLAQMANFFILHSYKDIFRRKFHFALAFFSVFLVVASTLIINQVITKGSIIFLKMAESTHGEIDAFITPSADIMSKTQEGISYETASLMNFSAIYDYYQD